LVRAISPVSFEHEHEHKDEHLLVGSCYLCNLRRIKRPPSVLQFQLDRRYPAWLAEKSGCAGLACIDHKSSAAVTTVTLNSIRICAECRLWQRNSPAAAGNHLRSSSYGVSATRVRSRHSEATAEFRCSFGRMFKNSSFDLCILKSGS